MTYKYQAYVRKTGAETLYAASHDVKRHKRCFKDNEVVLSSRHSDQQIE
jgi:hypothetical protein